jgi:hypothetical protein
MIQVQTRKKNELYKAYTLQYNEELHRATFCAEIVEREEPSVRG